MRKGRIEKVEVQEVEAQEVKYEPIIVTEITPQSIKEKIITKVISEKRVIETKVPIPVGYVRCEVLKDYLGMKDNLFTGDIIDLPERRFKTLSIRGLVREYKGNIAPSDKR
jgi:hypothetical protein